MIQNKINPNGRIIIAGNNSNIINTGKNSNVLLIVNETGSTGLTGLNGPIQIGPPPAISVPFSSGGSVRFTSKNQLAFIGNGTSSVTTMFGSVAPNFINLSGNTELNAIPIRIGGDTGISAAVLNMFFNLTNIIQNSGVNQLTPFIYISHPTSPNDFKQDAAFPTFVISNQDSAHSTNFGTFVSFEPTARVLVVLQISSSEPNVDISMTIDGNIGFRI